MQIKVSSSQFNYTYGNRIHFPYSIALLVSYIKTKEKFSQFKFDKTFVFRNEEKIEELNQLIENGEKKSEIARRLGISRETLYRHLRSKESERPPSLNQKIIQE